MPFLKTLQIWGRKYEIKCPYSLSNENLFTCDNEIELDFDM